MHAHGRQPRLFIARTVGVGGGVEDDQISKLACLHGAAILMPKISAVRALADQTSERIVAHMTCKRFGPVCGADLQGFAVLERWRTGANTTLSVFNI
ncbi:hypothetical protein [Ralstonia sp. Ralssp135]|uniref:hypothetical protein n=1 Tax=Ralstonia sp. Ralssp135 TaxID=3243016 RepID=UPI0039AF2688